MAIYGGLVGAGSSAVSIPQNLSAFTNDVGYLAPHNGIIYSENADYAEIGEWYDGNPNNENRVGHFVTLRKGVEGFVIDKATATSDVCGVIVNFPAFTGNADNKFDANHNLLRQYDYVALLGLVSVIDNGRCTVPGKCMPDANGTAVNSSNNMGFNVISRIDSTHIEVFVRPGADMLQRIKSDITALESASYLSVVNGKLCVMCEEDENESST